MNGVKLSSPELAYLLATLECDAVIGLEDPSLFPSSASTTGKTYKKGRSELEENGWIRPVLDRPAEYELDALLLEAVSVLASPDFMIASTFATDEDASQTAFHYLASDRIVELVAQDKKSYWLGFIESREQVVDRIAELMQIAAPVTSAEAEMDAKVFEKVKGFVEDGKLGDAAEVLDDIDLGEDLIQSLLAGIEDSPRGSLIAVRVENGEISSGRRFHIYGSGESAWISYKPTARSTDLILRSCSPETITDSINAVLNL